MVSVGDATEISKIYGFGGRFVKSDFYHVLLLYTKGKPVPTIFATQDERLHRTLRKPVAAMYSTTKILTLEPFVDITLQNFIDRLDTLFANQGLPCDLGTWLRYFAFDVMGDLTFSRPLGFLATGMDVDGIIRSIWTYFYKAAPVTQIPWVDWLWTKNPLRQRVSVTKPNPVVEFGLRRIGERTTSLENDSEPLRNGPEDFLSQFLQCLDRDKLIPRWALTAWMTSNITAGSDTTAILMRAVFYYLFTNRESMQALMSELDTAQLAGELSAIVSWKEAQALPYLDACIKEASRLHPPFGLPLERVVPEGGTTICGQYLPSGTVVGMNAWVVHRDKDVFGHDSNSWRPERWFCDASTRRQMENSLLTVSILIHLLMPSSTENDQFGSGPRSCIGKPIALLEVYKVIPTLLQRYDFQSVDKSGWSWKVQNRWFVHQTGLLVRPKRRE
ncbi:hypothetical protein B0A52_01904 [Exophiala mesophila]|uniref:Uncharacterized protein n=1 Tax=Exophiala mesophila TaxID=212818 RepID=A0A438NEB5_EXOME|nr:hypothetical protein B0A52_01904 [Exophiala mesophila]